MVVRPRARVSRSSLFISGFFVMLSRSVDVAFSKVSEAVGIGRIFPRTVLHFYDARGSYIRKIESVYNNVSFH